MGSNFYCKSHELILVKLLIWPGNSKTVVRSILLTTLRTDLIYKYLQIPCSPSLLYCHRVMDSLNKWLLSIIKLQESLL